MLMARHLMIPASLTTGRTTPIIIDDPTDSGRVYVLGNLDARQISYVASKLYPATVTEIPLALAIEPKPPTISEVEYSGPPRNRHERRAQRKGKRG